jgi:zinc protease
MVETGTIDESGPTESGLAQLTTQLLSQGTKTYSALELAQAVENLGATLGAHSDRDFTTIGLSSLARDQSKALSLLADVTRNPAFSPDEIERKRQEICTALRRNLDDPGYHVSRLLARRLYGDHSYGHALLGESAVVESLSREDLLRFYERRFVPERSVLAIVGQFDREQVREEVKNEFGSWKGNGLDPEGLAERQDSNSLPAPDLEAATRDIHQMDGVSQATVRVACRVVPRQHSDYVPLVVLDQILGGGGFSSRLMRSLRDEMGWTYGASSSLGLHKQAGAWVAGFKTSRDTLEPAIDRLLSEIDLLGQSGPTDDEVEHARAYLSGSLPLDFETNAQWASHALEAELYGLPAFFWEDESRRLEDLTAADLLEVGSRYLRADRFAVAINGDFRDDPSSSG